MYLSFLLLLNNSLSVIESSAIEIAATTLAIMKFLIISKHLGFVWRARAEMAVQSRRADNLNYVTLIFYSMICTMRSRVLADSNKE